MKRLFDLLLPFLLLLALLVRILHGTPLFFSQVRPGQNGKPFRMLKFRTMTNARDAAGTLLPDSARSRLAAMRDDLKNSLCLSRQVFQLPRLCIRQPL